MPPTNTATTHDNMSSAQTEVLVEPDWLEAHLGDPAVRVVEVDVSAAAYEAGHVDGAVLWNIYRDLKDTNYALVEEPAIEQLIRRSGIGPETTVVLYGYAPAMGMWLLKLYGHADVRILNCSRQVWQDAARPWTTARDHADRDQLSPPGRRRHGRRRVRDGARRDRRPVHRDHRRPVGRRVPRRTLLALRRHGRRRPRRSRPVRGALPGRRPANRRRTLPQPGRTARDLRPASTWRATAT